MSKKIHISSFIGDAIITFSIVIGFIVAFFIFIGNNPEKSYLIPILIVVGGALLSAYPKYNAYIEVDKEKGVLSYPFGVIFRRTLKLSDIDDIEYNVESGYKTTLEGKVQPYRKDYIVFKGPFGQRYISASKGDYDKFISNLNRI